MSELNRDENHRGVTEILMNEIDPGPSILRCEVEEAVGKINWRKSEGSDGIVVEMIEAAGDVAISKILGLANRIYESREMPQTMKESEYSNS